MTDGLAARLDHNRWVVIRFSIVGRRIPKSWKRSPHQILRQVQIVVGELWDAVVAVELLDNLEAATGLVYFIALPVLYFNN